MTPHERLSAAMNARRLELRLQWKQLAAAAGIAAESLAAIRRGEYRPSELTAQALDEALAWAPGSVYDVLDGRGDARPLHQDAIVRPATARATAHTASATDRVQFNDHARAEILSGSGKSPEVVAQQARSAGITSGDLRRSGQAEAANRLLEIELQEKHGSKTMEQIREEAVELANQLVETIKRKAPNLRDDQLRAIETFSEGLAKVVLDFTRENPTSENRAS